MDSQPPPSNVKFSECGICCPSIPPWADYLIRLGHAWPRYENRTRRLCLISMPCDSPAAGLVALGALVRDLADPSANDIDGHYARLLRYADEFIHKCQPCDLEVCNPTIKRCGLERKRSGLLRHAEGRIRGTVQISKATNSTTGQIAWSQRSGRDSTCTVRPNPEETLNYRIDGEPPLQRLLDSGKINPSIYKAILPSAEIDGDNLARSYSGTCLAVRESAPKDHCKTSEAMFHGVNFTYEETAWPLTKLLAVVGWTDTQISRVATFNNRSRIHKMDRTGIKPTLVVADGHKAFLGAIGQDLFLTADIIGVVDRNQSREVLEEVRGAVTPNDWYAADLEVLCNLLPEINKPGGISIAAIKKAY
jgi:hypothetical protein